MMTPHEYQLETRRTRPAGEPRERALAHYALGLCEEAGELAGVVKKHVFYGHPLDRDKLVKEAGDVLWYLTSLLDTAGIGLQGAHASESFKAATAIIKGESANGDDYFACLIVVMAGYVVNDIGAGKSVNVLEGDAGDMLAYLAALLGRHDLTLPEVMTANVAKLRARYPGAWTAADAAERKDEVSA